MQLNLINNLNYFNISLYKVKEQILCNYPGVS
jgi:hypothetical protein